MLKLRQPERFRTKKEQGTVSEYLNNIRDWKTCQMVSNYLLACEKFKAAYTSSNPLSKFPFRDIGQICNILYNLKEEHHLIFRRVVGPEKIKLEDRHKIQPNESEIQFIANVGMLFHKILVARELKYIHMHYDPLSGVGSNAEGELIKYLQQINELFDKGIEVLLKFIHNHASNILILSYLLENSKSVKKSIGVTGIQVLKKITGQSNLAPIYYLIGKYYVESGWYDRAAKLLKKTIKMNPKHTEARDLLEEVKVRSIALKPRGNNNHKLS